MFRATITSLYTIQFKNGEVLRHQSPLQLAQFRCDARLSTFWVEFDPKRIDTNSTRE
jgi:hypothetical protein